MKIPAGDAILATCQEQYFKKKRNQWAKELGRGHLAKMSYFNWCGIFAGWVLKKNGFSIPATPEGARQYLKTGRKVTEPKRGDLVIFWRIRPDSWQGHVAFFCRYKKGRKSMVVVGGNQGPRSDPKVCSQVMASDRVLGFRRLESVSDSLSEIKNSVDDLVNQATNLQDRLSKI